MRHRSGTHTDKGGVSQARQTHGGCEVLQTPAGEGETNSRAGEGERGTTAYTHSLTLTLTLSHPQSSNTYTHTLTHQSRVQGGHRQACVMDGWVAAASRVETRRVGGFGGGVEKEHAGQETVMRLSDDLLGRGKGGSGWVLLTLAVTATTG